jgi:general secretion pathway protein I
MINMWIFISELKYLKFKVPKFQESYKKIKQIEPIQPIKQRSRSITLDTYNFRHFQSGFTLLEVMIAMAIIAIALVAVFGSQSQSLSLANEAKFNTTAALLAQSKMAEIEILDSEDLASDSGDFREDFPDYHWDLNVRDVTFAGAEEASGHLKQIDLSLSWGKHDQYQYRLRLYRFVPKNK